MIVDWADTTYPDFERGSQLNLWIEQAHMYTTLECGVESANTVRSQEENSRVVLNCSEKDADYRIPLEVCLVPGCEEDAGIIEVTHYVTSSEVTYSASSSKRTHPHFCASWKWFSSVCSTSYDKFRVSFSDDQRLAPVMSTNGLDDIWVVLTWALSPRSLHVI